MSEAFSGESFVVKLCCKKRFRSDILHRHGKSIAVDHCIGEKTFFETVTFIRCCCRHDGFFRSSAGLVGGGIVIATVFRGDSEIIRVAIDDGLCIGRTGRLIVLGEVRTSDRARLGFTNVIGENQIAMRRETETSGTGHRIAVPRDRNVINRVQTIVFGQ